ncbi:hypothetical protein BG005_001770 [Podila minutissima]|nr:hypothetical protein BG005_001770 [Podila minutissima]
MGPRWQPADPRLPPPDEHGQHLVRIIQHINFLFRFIPGIDDAHLGLNIMARLDTIRRAMDLDGQRYREINSECHHLRSEMERLRAERDRAEEERVRAEEGLDRLRADNKHYRNVNRRLSDYNEKMLTDYNELKQRHKSLEERQGSEHLPKEIVHSFSKGLRQIKTELDEKTTHPHGNRGPSSMVSSEELSRAKEDVHQTPRDIAQKENENVDLRTHLLLMEQAIRQQENKIAQLTRELEQAKKRGIHPQGLVQHNDDHGKIRSLEDKAQTLQSQLDQTALALRNSNEVIKMMTEKQERSAYTTQVIHNLEQLKADIEREQARQSRNVSMKAILEYTEQFGYQSREEEFEMRIKELEVALEEVRESKVSAIEIPLIISIIALQLSQADLWSCVQVSHPWHSSFLPFLWRSINLTKRKRFRSLDHDTIRTHGAHIRHLEGIDSRNIAAVQVNSIRQLKSLVITLTTDARFNANCFDLIRKNMHCLQSLVLSRATQPGAIVAVLPFASLILPDIFIPMPSLGLLRRDSPPTKTTTSTSSGTTTTSSGTTSGQHTLVEPMPLSRGSALQSVTLKYVDMTRDGFSIFLQVCPALEELSLERFEIIEEAHDDYIQHSRIKTLTASLDQIWYPSSSSSSSSTSLSSSSSSLSSPLSPGSGLHNVPLLIHFPKLETWTFPNGQIKRTDLSMGNAVVEIIARLCPKLVHVNFGDLVAESVFALLLSWFKHLQRVTLHYTSFVGSGGGGGGGSNVLSALLVHQDTLREIVLLDKGGKPFEAGSPPPLPPSPGSSSTLSATATPLMEGKIVQLLFRSCRHLEKVSMPMVELDVAHMEEYPWGCANNLRELHVRFKGMSSGMDEQVMLFHMSTIVAERASSSSSSGSSSSEVQKTIYAQQLRESEKFQASGEASSIEEDQARELSATIHGRLALQLHRMKKLEFLWIGSKMLRRRGGANMFVELS